MSDINFNLIPGSTRNYSGLHEESSSGRRQCTHYGYMGIDGKEGDFTMSDLISMGVLWASAISQEDSKLLFYREGFYSLCRAFGNPDVSEFLDILGIEPKKDKKKTKPFNDDLFRTSGIVRFLWFRAKMIEVQDPFWHVMEGDIWGRNSHRKNKEASKAIADGISFYEDVLRHFTNGLTRLDKAICTHLGWKYEGNISLKELKSKFDFPESETYFEDDF